MSAVGETLADRATRAAQWRFAGAGIGVVSQLAVGVVLARVLRPADFGVMALAFVVLGLVRPLGDLGIGGAVVQRAALTDRHIRTAFTLAVLFGLSASVVLAATAPLCAGALRDPNVTPVLRMLAAGIGLQGVAVVAGALLRRRLAFRCQFFIDTVTYVVGYGAIAICLALHGYGVWSLVWGSLVQTVGAAGAQFVAVRHPMRPLLARRELTDLLHFSVGATVNACVNYVALNADNLVVGRWSGTVDLGLYARAYNLMTLPFTYAASVMSGVLFPALAQVQAEPRRLQRAYLLATQITAMIAASSMGTIAIAAPHLVRTLYGSQWTGVVVPLQILCLAGYFRALYHLSGIVAHSVGRVYSELWRQAIYAILVITGALVGLRYGLGGVALGVSLAILYMFVATSQLCLGAMKTPWRLYLRAQRGALLTAFATCTVALAMRALLEATQASSTVITIGIMAGSAVPWSIGMMRALGEPGFESLRARLPVSVAQLVKAFGRGGAQIVHR